MLFWVVSSGHCINIPEEIHYCVGLLLLELYCDLIGSQCSFDAFFLVKLVCVSFEVEVHLNLCPYFSTRHNHLIFLLDNKNLTIIIGVGLLFLGYEDLVSWIRIFAFYFNFKHPMSYYIDGQIETFLDIWDKSILHFFVIFPMSGECSLKQL